MIILWFFVRYGVIAAPLGLIVGLVQGDGELILGASIWLVISYTWLLSRLAKRRQQEPSQGTQGSP